MQPRVGVVVVQSSAHGKSGMGSKSKRNSLFTEKLLEVLKEIPNQPLVLAFGKVAQAMQEAGAMPTMEGMLPFARCLAPCGVSADAAIQKPEGKTEIARRQMAQAAADEHPLDEARKVGSRFSCGTANVLISGATISVTRGPDRMELSYDTADFIGGHCVLDSKHRPRIVFQAYCGGSGCGDVGNWGIVDPESMQLLLEPRDDNFLDAKKILGKEPPSPEMGTSKNPGI